MEYLPNPHDRLFKETWSRKENAQSFLRNFLPDYLLSSIDLDSLEICKDSFVEEDLKEYFSDLLYKTTLSGRRGYLYFLFEHKSHPEKRVALQLLSYQQSIWNLHLKQESLPLPVVVAMVLYHGMEQWTVGNNLLHLFGETKKRFLPHIPDFRYLLYDLSRYPDEAIKGAVMFQATMLLFKYVFRPDYHERLPSIFALLRMLLEKETAMEYIETVLRYVLSTVENMSAEDVKSMVEQSLSPEKGELVMTLAERLRNEGRQQGLQQGIHEGLVEAIELGLGIKFGTQGMKLMPAIHRIKDAEKLRAIKEAVKIAKNISEVKEVIVE